MFITVLGSAAGGGFPQWNCNCHNCEGIRAGSVQALPRTQSSIALSDSGRDWILCNASPEILQQLRQTPELHPPAGSRRGTAIGSIILTDSQIDHTLGLLNLREGCPHQVWCTREVQHDLSTSFPVFNMLKHWNGGIQAHEIIPGQAFRTAVCEHLKFTAVPILSNAPPYSEWRDRPLPGHNVALFIEDHRTGRALFYTPGLGQVEAPILERMKQADCLLIDGTLWKDQELSQLGVGTRTGQDMGHLALQESDGLLGVLGQLTTQRKILIHINNTNPILDENSPERAQLNALGIEVSYDGMRIEL